jgi:hypothetical protein
VVKYRLFLVQGGCCERSRERADWEGRALMRIDTYGEENELLPYLPYRLDFLMFIKRLDFHLILPVLDNSRLL